MELKHFEDDGTYKEKPVDVKEKICNKPVANQIFGGGAGILECQIMCASPLDRHKEFYQEGKSLIKAEIFALTGFWHFVKGNQAVQRKFSDNSLIQIL